MNYRRVLGSGLLFVLAWCIWSAPVDAADIEFAGVVGNSGEAGSTLVTHGAYPTWRPGRRAFSHRNNGNGVVQDRYGYLWARAGLDQLNRYAVDGRLIATYPLPKPRGLFYTTRMALVDGTVVIQDGGRIFTLRVDAPAGTEPRRLDGEGWQIAWHGVDGRLPAMRENRLLWLDPQTAETEKICTLPVPAGHSTLELLPDGTIYCLSRDGSFRIEDGEARPIEKRVPHWTIFVDGYWYSFAWHATIRRHSRDFRADPGVVLGGNSGSFIGRVPELGEVVHPTGLVKMEDDLYAMSGFGPSVHLLQWREELQSFEAVRRLGGTSRLRLLGLDGRGVITTNAGFWHWDDAPDAVLRDGGSVSGATSQAVVMPDGTLIGAHYRHGQPGFFLKKPDGYFSGSRLSPEEAPLPGPGLFWGAAWYRLPEDKRGVLLVTNPAGEAQSFYFNPGTRNAYQAFGGHAGPVRLKTSEPVENWRSLDMLGEETLLAAADGEVLSFERDGTDWKETTRFAGRPGDPFGERIEISCDAGRLWVADTRRHRVQCFDARTRQLIGRHGRTDAAGRSIDQLDRPTVITAGGERCVVFDSKNYRIVKLRLEGER